MSMHVFVVPPAMLCIWPSLYTKLSTQGHRIYFWGDETQKADSVTCNHMVTVRIMIIKEDLG